MTQDPEKIIRYQYELGIDGDIWINSGIVVFLYLQYNLKIAAIGIAVIIMFLYVITPFLE